MRTKLPLFPDNINSPWRYVKRHSSNYGLYATDGMTSISWGTFKTIAAMKDFARANWANAFDYPHQR